MTFDSPMSERRLRSAARLVHQGMWLLLVIAIGLMAVLRRGVTARTGSVWFLGCAVLAFALSFALRDVVRKVGHRNTEDKIVRDVKNFLEQQPDPAVAQPVPAKTAVVQAAIAADEIPAPARPDFIPLAGFVPMEAAVVRRATAADPVVFDVFPPRRAAAFKIGIAAVLPCQIFDDQASPSRG